MLSGISIWQLLIILVIVMLLFGTKKLKNIGSDLGGAVKGFKDSVKEGQEEQANANIEKKEEGETIEGSVESKESDKA